MKKLLHILPVTVISACFFSGVAGAQSLPDCDLLVINGTGPGSTNQIVCEVSTDVRVDCKNNVYILDENSQSAVSGDAAGQGNVTDNTAITGNAVNSNDEVVEIGASCGESNTEPGRGSTTPTGGKGGFAPTQLPNTTASSFSPLLLAGVASTTILASITAIILALSRRLGNK